MPNSLNLLHENCVADSEGNCLGDLKSESVNKKLQYKRSHDKLHLYILAAKRMLLMISYQMKLELLHIFSEISCLWMFIKVSFPFLPV